MSSATLTKGKPQANTRAPARSGAADTAAPVSSGAWAFFLLSALAVGAVAVVLLRHTGGAPLFFIVFTLLGAGAAGVALYRTLAPLTGEPDEASATVVGRTRAALERDKMLTLRAIKELEFDRAMGKISESDFTEMRDRLRDRALRLLRQLDGAGLYRQLIEREVAARLCGPADAVVVTADVCLECGTGNDRDARFCKMCGTSLVQEARP
jgi:F0F1-type ATP synthase assembly protein I